MFFLKSSKREVTFYLLMALNIYNNDNCWNVRDKMILVRDILILNNKNYNTD